MDLFDLLVEQNPDGVLAFDREYLEAMIDDHEDMVKTFEKHAKDGEDAETVAYARKHLPKLQQHLQHAIDLKRTLTDKRERR